MAWEEKMSAIGAISAFSALSYQMTSRMMQDAAAVEEGDEDGEVMVENEPAIEIESGSEDEEFANEIEEGSSLGGQLDAWG
jgi:hypothetical protein